MTDTVLRALHTNTVYTSLKSEWTSKWGAGGSLPREAAGRACPCPAYSTSSWMGAYTVEAASIYWVLTICNPLSKNLKCTITFNSRNHLIKFALLSSLSRWRTRFWEDKVAKLEFPSWELNSCMSANWAPSSQPVNILFTCCYQVSRIF